ncbi:MAG: ABC transporter substrate-binding protein [Chloroflexota bacterium]
MKYLTHFLTTLLLLALLAACVPVEAPSVPAGDVDEASTDAGATRTFMDDAGRTVEIPTDPQRIIALTDSNAAAMILSLGVPLVGMATRDEVFDSGITNVYDVSDVEPIGNYSAPNIELIAALNPDLIIGAAWQDAPEFDYETENMMQIAPVVYIDSFVNIDQTMATYGDLLGKEDEVVRQKAEYEARVEEMRTQLGNKLEQLSVSIMLFSDPANVGTVGEGWWSIGKALQDIGVTRPPMQAADGPAGEEGWFQASVEEMPEFEADVVIYADYGYDPFENELFKGLAAVEAGQVYRFSEEFWNGTYAGLNFTLDQLEEMLLEEDIAVDLAL